MDVPEKRQAVLLSGEHNDNDVAVLLLNLIVTNILLFDVALVFVDGGGSGEADR